MNTSRFSGSVLPRKAILALLDEEPPLIADYLDLNAQLQPQGFDLTVQSVAELKGLGQIGPTDEHRRLPAIEPLAFDTNGYLELKPGCYIVITNEVVSLPLDITALGRPRSSLLRSGVTVGTAVWDAGYSGRSQCLLTIHNSAGFRLGQNARFLQLIFLKLQKATDQGYAGVYQGENIRAPSSG